MAAKKSVSPSIADRALLDAAFICDLIKVRQALAEGADPNARDEDERTPLFSAVLGGSIGLMGLLLEAGADVNARDHHGFAPLHFAAQERLPEMARLLLAKGADANAKDEDGATPLWRAVFSDPEHGELAKILLAAGAKPELASRPTPALVQAMPRAFMDTLPSRAAAFAGKDVTPKPLGQVSWADAQPWIDAEPALRRGFVKRWRGLARVPEFRHGLVAGLKAHPEWDPVLNPPLPRPASDPSRR